MTEELEQINEEVPVHVSEEEPVINNVHTDGMLLPVVHDTAVGTPEDTAFLSANGEKDVVHAVPRISSAETAAYADVE